MAKPKKTPASLPKKSGAPRDGTRRWRIALHVFIGLFLVCSSIEVFRIMRNFVDRKLAFPTRPPNVVLVNRPVWMSDLLVEQISKEVQPIGLHSSFDHQLLVDTANALQSNPWIRHVNQVRRAYDEKPGDTIEIDCDYRTPTALVKWGQYFWLVDADGVKLPEQYTESQLPKIMFGTDGKINIRIIDGVSHAPVESGNIWPGSDLAGGLELAKLIAGKSYTEEIRRIDVSNYAGRRDPREAEIVLVTKYNTQIRWGRPPSAQDAFIEVPAATKLAALENLFEQKKRVDANEPWIDIRFDRITCPSPTPVDAAADAGSK